MPAPTRTSMDAIVAAAGRILEEDGLERLTMAAVAEQVGVRGPSLYKHVPNRALLIRAVAEGTAGQLGAAIQEGVESSPDPRLGLRAGVTAHRAYVRTHPNGYGLLFAHLLPESMPDAALVAAVGLPIVRRAAELVGPERALPAARTLVAWAHGFVSMELAGAFRLGGDVDEAFEFGLVTLLAGLGQETK